MMPTGVVIAVVAATINTVPTIAFHRPPPSSPGGGVVSEKSAQFSAPTPLTTSVYKIQTRKAIPKAIAQTDINMPSP
jgi:hypothetical protein